MDRGVELDVFRVGVIRYIFKFYSGLICFIGMCAGFFSGFNNWSFGINYKVVIKFFLYFVVELLIVFFWEDILEKSKAWVFRSVDIV